VAKETGSEELLPKGYRWDDLISYRGDNLLGYYQEMLTHLGASAENNIVKEIYAFPTTVFSHSENLRVVIDGINGLNWHIISEDSIGSVYEGLLAKNSEDVRSGAGQYFTPRALVDCVVQVIQPKPGEIIQDPATGTGGFLIAADQYVRHGTTRHEYERNPPSYYGVEIERGTYRLCLMNIFLHRMNANIILGDTLTTDASVLEPADVIIANPPFGARAGGVRSRRKDIPFRSSNKQIEFLQHIYRGLKPGGRAAVVLPDNVLFEDGIGRLVRQQLMEECCLHTVLRLPAGIFYAQGVKTNVLFFSRFEGQGPGTKAVWFYDLRTNMPKFGKRSPLAEKHFSDFVKFYGPDPRGKAARELDLGSDRFRRFSRAEIAKGNDSLDITWLKDNRSMVAESGMDLEDLAVEISRLLTLAANEVVSLQSQLAYESRSS
jgi:type I restriction enzyme M protein